MDFKLSLFGGGFNSALVQKQAVNEVMRYNDVTAKYGLALTEQQAIALVETRTEALEGAGRIEFGGGVIDKIILEFCNSPYLSTYNYEEILHELIEIFYYYKNDTLDILSDDELIKQMKTLFDGVCKGSLELLAGRELDRLARNLRYGYAADRPENADEPDEEEQDGEY